MALSWEVQMAEDPATTKPGMDDAASDAWVDQIIAKTEDPDEFTTGVAVLIGYLGHGVGEGDKGERWRLYSSVDLGEYVEFEVEDVLSNTPLKGPLGGYIIRLKANAPVSLVISTNAGSLQQQGLFLQGGITNSFMPRGWSGAGRIAGMQSTHGCSTVTTCWG